MKVRTISATSLEVFENCASRFWAEKVEYADDVSGVHANLGSACHEVLERWVKEGWYLQDPMPDFTIMEAFFIEAYYKLFSEHSDFYDQGIDMLRKWYDRQDWNGVEVVSVEVKERFALKVPGDEEQLVTYIFDRLDLFTREYGDTPEPRVVDYKSVGQPISADDMKKRIQPRLYACAAQLLYPDAPGVWVVYDLLRYDEVGVYYTKEENRATYRYLQSVAARIRATEPMEPTQEEQVLIDTGRADEVVPRYPESINPNCRWCVRKASCETIRKNIAVGGQFSIDNVDDAIDLAAQLKWQAEALKAAQEQMNDYIMKELIDSESTEAETESTTVKIQARSVTKVESQPIAKIVGAETFSRFATIGATNLNTMLKDPEIRDEDKSRIKTQFVKKIKGNPFLKFGSKTMEDES